MRLALSILLLCCSSARAATWYVDGTAAGAGNGTNWTHAWTSLTLVTGVTAGDTVYISGGSTSKRYFLGDWVPAGGTSNSPVRYQTGQDAGHNGCVIFDGWNTNAYWIKTFHNAVISGQVGTNRHMLATNYTSTSIYLDGSTGFGLHYIETINLSRFNGASDFEISHCLFRPWATSDYALAFSAMPETHWGDNSIHHCKIVCALRNDNSGYGDDFIQNVASCDIYNNEFVSEIVSSYPWGQHQDGIQTRMGQLRIYNNRFVNLGNYSVYLDVSQPVYAGAYVHHNIFQRTAVSSGQCAVAVGPAPEGVGCVISNVWVFNNTVVDHDGREGIGIRGVVNGTVYTNNVCLNNLLISCGGVGLKAVDNSPSGVYTAWNHAVAAPNGVTTISPANAVAPVAAGVFGVTSYVQYSSNNVVTMTGPGFTGTNLSALATTDFAGTTRAAWTVGAYEWTASGSGGTPATNGTHGIWSGRGLVSGRGVF